MLYEADRNLYATGEFGVFLLKVSSSPKRLLRGRVGRTANGRRMGNQPNIFSQCADELAFLRRRDPGRRKTGILGAASVHERAVEDPTRVCRESARVEGNERQGR